MKLMIWMSVVLLLTFASQAASAFQSDELPEDDEDWGIVGGGFTGKVPEKAKAGPLKSSSSGGVGNTGNAERFKVTSPSADRKVQFTLEHSFKRSEFVPAGVFTARLRELVKGGQTLSKFRLARNPFSDEEKKAFKELLQTDGFYSIRVPSNALSPGRSFALSSVKARCLAASNFQERFEFHMDQGHIIGVMYGGSISCSYPRALQIPSQWTFDSSIIVKSGEQATRSFVAPEIVEVAAEEDQVKDDGTLVKMPEKSFWGKYWMYIVPLGLIVVNAITQAANLPEEATPGQAGGGAQPRVAGPGAGSRRR